MKQGIFGVPKMTVTKSVKVKVIVDDKLGYAYLYPEATPERQRVKHHNLIYEYIRKRIVFRVPRDLEDKAFLIVPLDRDLLAKEKLLILVKLSPKP